MKQRRTIGRPAAAALVGCPPQTLTYRALVAKPVHTIALTTVPEETS
jgi:hypothetical protein